MGNCVEEARYVANDLEANDTLEGYRGSKTIRDLAVEYEVKAHESEVWHTRFKEEHTAHTKLMAHVNELENSSGLQKRVADSLIEGDTEATLKKFMGDLEKWQAAEAKILEALEGCKYCKHSNTSLPYCQGCLESIAKAAARPV